MDKKIIALDFDDVLFPFTHEFLIYCAEKFQINIQDDDLKKYRFEELLGLDESEVNQLQNDFIFSERHTNISPTRGAREALSVLKNTYDFVVISARPKNQESLVRIWLQKNLGVEVTGFYLVDHYTEGKTEKIKANIAKEVGVSYFIEDNLLNSIQIAEIGIPVFLITREWNEEQEIKSKSITRVASWENILLNIPHNEIPHNETEKIEVLGPPETLR